MAQKKVLVQKPPKPRGRTRPFYVHGCYGRGRADGTIDATRIISFGPFTNDGALDLDIYMKTGATTTALVLHLEGRTSLDGRITLKVKAMQQKGEPLVYSGEAWRDGQGPTNPGEGSSR